MTTPADRKIRQLRARQHAQLAKNVPCQDCGKTYPYWVMDFDHRSDKRFTINKYVKSGPSLSTLQLEIDKCDVVCSNCHRERTYARLAQ